MTGSIGTVVRAQHKALEQKKIDELVEIATRLKQSLSKYDSLDSMEEAYFITKGTTFLREVDLFVKGFLSLSLVKEKEEKNVC